MCKAFQDFNLRTSQLSLFTRPHVPTPWHIMWPVCANFTVIISIDIYTSSSFKMIELHSVDAKGTLPCLKVAVVPIGEILWPAPFFYNVAYPESPKTYFQSLDKSAKTIQNMYEGIFSARPPRLAAPRNTIRCFCSRFCCVKFPARWK